MDDRTQQLDLTAPIPTGNTKAAAAAAGATSSDLWMTPYESLRYDPADNVRPVDHAWVKELTALMMKHGYDKASPLHCYVRKVDGKDLFYVFKGQHRYLAAGNAIKSGNDLGKIPIVVLDSREVKRPKMVVDGYLSNRSKPSSPLDLATSIAELRDVHKMDASAICAELHISEQSIRDAALLEKAPIELHELVRNGSIAGTLAIEEIRTHGGDKALERIASGLAKAQEAGKSKVTKKHLAGGTSTSKPAAVKATRVNEARAKQLLQAMQSVLHDPCFGKLSPGTIEGVHRALSGLEDLLDLPERPKSHPVHIANKYGVYAECETLRSPKSKNPRNADRPAEIHVAQPEEGAWIQSFTLQIQPGYIGGLPSMRQDTIIYRTRGEAIRAAAAHIERLMQHADRAKSKDATIVNEWLHALSTMPDPDWTPEMAQEAAQ